MDSLLDVVRGIFLKEFSNDLKKTNKSRIDYSRFDPTFNALVTKLDKTAQDAGARPSDTESASEAQLTPPSSSAGTEDGADEAPALPPPIPGFKRTVSARQTVTEASSADVTPLATPDASRPSSPAVNHLLTAKGPGGKLSRRAKKALSTSTPASSGDESSTSRRPLGARKASSKAKRRWDADGFAAEDDEDEVLDYSQQGGEAAQDDPLQIEDVRSDQMGSRTGKGQFVLKDLDDEVDAIIAESKAEQNKREEASGLLGSSMGAISGYFKNIVGGKTLTKEDLQKPLKTLEDHLLNKNVAREAAVRLCESVERDMVGVKTANFTSECLPTADMATSCAVHADP